MMCEITIEQGGKILGEEYVLSENLREGWSMLFVGPPDEPVVVTVRNYIAALQPKEGSDVAV
jgi:hypothetical protein